MEFTHNCIASVIITCMAAVSWVPAAPSFASTLGAENVQIVVKETAADSTGVDPVITVTTVESSTATEPVGIPEAPAIPEKPDMVVIDAPSIVTSSHAAESSINLSAKLPEIERLTEELRLQAMETGPLTNTAFPTATVYDFRVQADELNRQFLAQNFLVAQSTGQKQSDKAAWEAYRSAYNEILSARWKQAVSALDLVEKKYGKSDWADDAAYWSAYAREKSGDNPEQVYRQYQSFVDRYPGSRWVETARANMVGVANRLALSGNPEFTEKIRQVGFDGNLSVTLTALTALQMMGEDAIPEMETLYRKTSSPATKERILSTVLANRSLKSTDFLIRVAETDSSDAFRKRAVDFIGSSLTFNKQATDVYSNGVTMTVTPKSKTTSPEEKKAVLDALGRIARDDPSEIVRGQALYWLGKSGTDEGWAKFLETTAKTDPSMEVRQKALLALAQMPEGKGVPGLIAVAKSDAGVSIRTLAITYLGMSKDSRAKEALKEIVRRGD